MTGEEALESAARSIDCPIEWCSGEWLDHGGQGQSPESWVHHDREGFALPHGARLFRDQLGSDPVDWILTLEHDGISAAVVCADDLGVITSILRTIASAVESVAVIDGIGWSETTA